MRRMLAAHALAVLAAACGAAPPSLDELAERYVRVTLQLAQHDPALVEAWTGPDSLKPGPRIPVASIAREVDDLGQSLEQRGADISSAEERSRLSYLEGQVNALRFAAGRLLGRSTSIDDQLREEFGLEPAAFDQAAIDRALGALDRALPGQDPLPQRVAALRSRTAIPRDRRKAVMDVAVQACREPVASLIDLPKQEQISIVFRPDLGWDAFARDTGGSHTTIEISDEGPLDLSRALRLACHEGYAGHHTQHVLRDRLNGTRQWVELGLMPGFGPHLLWAEGSAEVGADLVFTADQRAALYRGHLFPAAGVDVRDVDALVTLDDLLPRLLPVVTDVARQYLETKVSQEQAIDRLTHDAMIANASGTLAFIERRRARALVYGEGRRAVASRLPSPTLTALRDLFPFRAALQ